MRFYKRKFIIALICLAASAALTWKLLDLVDQSKETVNIVQVSAYVEKGARVTSEMLRRVEVGAFGLDSRVIVSEDLIVGKYAACDLFPGDVLITEKLKTIDEIADNYVQKTRDANKAAVSIQLKSVSAGLSGKLKIGDVVSAFVFVSEGGVGSNKGRVITYPELQYLEVAAVTNSRAEDIQYEPDRFIDYERLKVTGDSAIPATVILIVDEKQAVRLVEAENIGAVHLVFRGRGEYAQQLLCTMSAGDNGGAAGGGTGDDDAVGDGAADVKVAASGNATAVSFVNENTLEREQFFLD